MKNLNYKKAVSRAMTDTQKVKAWTRKYFLGEENQNIYTTRAAFTGFHLILVCDCC